jgi:pyruvate/2-oxoglutarate dehydrogenase complex dihydrolipoamide dehydrogenase (E3) component
MIQLAAVAVKAGLTKPQWERTMALHPPRRKSWC